MSKNIILFLAANPRASSRLRLEEECAAIQRELKMSPYREDFHLESQWAVSVDELIRDLNELAPTVIHFSGHGSEGQAVARLFLSVSATSASRSRSLSSTTISSATTKASTTGCSPLSRLR